MKEVAMDIAATTPTYDIPALRKAYAKDGAVKLPGLVSSAWVERLRAAFTEFLKRDPGEVYSTNFGHGPGRTTIRFMWREEPELLRFARGSGVAPVIGGIVGASFLRFWYDNSFIHEAGYDKYTRQAGYEREMLAGTPWHHDAVVFPFKGEMNPGLWVALTDVTEDSAPLQIIKGSHLSDVLYRPAVYTDQNVLEEGFESLPDWDAKVAAGACEKVVYTMTAGDALVLHPRLIHGAPPAKDNAPTRIGFSSRWAGDDIRWWPHPYSMKFLGVKYDEVEVGTPPEGEFFPLVWQA
jgi:hypothetical protein